MEAVPRAWGLSSWSVAVWSVLHGSYSFVWEQFKLDPNTLLHLNSTLKEQQNGVHKGFCCSAFPEKRCSICSSPLAVLITLCSQLPCQIRPSVHLLQGCACSSFESSSTPLLHQTHAKTMNFSCLSHPISWNLLVPQSTYPSVGAEHEELCYHSTSADRDSSVVLSSSSVNSSSGPCAPMSWTIQEPTYLEKVLF